MGSVTSIGRRLTALEALQGSSLTHLSDEELRLRIALLDARLVAGLEAEGVAIPADIDALPERERHGWIAERVRGLG